MLRLLLLAAGACVTAYGVANEWEWYWIAVNVALDAVAFVSAVKALGRM